MVIFRWCSLKMSAIFFFLEHAPPATRVVPCSVLVILPFLSVREFSDSRTWQQSARTYAGSGLMEILNM